MQNTYILAMFFQNQMIFLSTLQQDGMSNGKKTKRDFIQLIITCIYIERFEVWAIHMSGF